MRYKVVRLELPHDGAKVVLFDNRSLRQALVLEAKAARTEPFVEVGIKTMDGVLVSRRISLV